jgi:flavin reductase (DIM6/NTAB) family NADH-FMN oxidoreductase RutF
VIAECLAHMECIVKRRVETGDKILVVGQVVEAYADRSKLTGEVRIPFAAGEFPRKVYGTRFPGRIAANGQKK